MKYFKSIELDWVPFQKKILNLIEEQPKLIEKEQGHFVLLSRDQIITVYPELKNMIKPLGDLNILYVALYTFYGSKGTLHVDRTHLPIRITLPIMNCEHSVTTFYKVDSEGVEGTQNNGLGATYYDPEKSIPVASYYLDRPYVIRVLEPHQVVTTNKSIPRISCTLGFKEDIEHLLED